MKNLLTVSILILLFLGTAFSQGLIGYWPMEENGGNVIYDSSGNGFNGKFNGAVPAQWPIGTKGFGLSFDGTSQYVAVADKDSLRITNVITLAAWIAPGQKATQRIICKAFLGTGATAYDGYELSLATGGTVFVRFNQKSHADVYRVNAATPYPIDGSTWMHAAATFDGSTIKLYINGIQEGGSLSMPDTISTYTDSLYIGRQKDPTNPYRFKGKMDEARIYHRALSAAEILVLAQTKTWNGGTTNWNTAANWNPSGVPTSVNDLTIMSGGLPTLTAGGSCRNLIVNSGATLNCSNYNLSVGGNAVINGTVVYGTGRITPAGTFTRNNLSGTGIQYLLSAYNYIDITTAGITSITIQEYAGTAPLNTPPEYDATKGVNRYYTISALGGGGGAGKVGLDYLLTEKGANLLPTDGCVWEYSGSGPWLNMGGGGAGSGADWCWGSMLTPIDASALAGNYTIADGTSALPLQLASFVGSYVGNSAKLEWSTVSEVNNFGFNVQRYNSNAKTYQDIGFVAGKGTTLETQTYTYLDNDVTGNVEYRLEQIDNNGLKNYFGPIMLNPNGASDETVPAVFKIDQNYPNPFNPNTIIKYQLSTDNYTTLKVYNIVGVEVATLINGYQTAGNHKVTFDGSNLSSGLYFYKLQSGINVEIKKMVLMK
jgi:hypothetical protein